MRKQYFMVKVKENIPNYHNSTEGLVFVLEMYSLRGQQTLTRWSEVLGGYEDIESGYVLSSEWLDQIIEVTTCNEKEN